jgi:hypothetical protein
MGDMFGGGGSTGTSVSTQSSEPWSGQQPYLTQGFAKAQSDVLNNPTQPYPNSTVVPFAPQTEAALQATQNRAMQGSPVQGAGNQAYLDTISGNYLGPNPFLQGAIDAASQGAVRNFQTAVQPGIDAGASQHGRYGSGQHFNQLEGAYNALGQQLSNTAAGMAYQNYGDERGRQMMAATNAPQMASADYNDMAKLMGVGQAYEGQAGAQLQDEMQRWYENQNMNKKALADYMSLVAGGNFGQSTTTSQPIYSSGQGMTNMLGLAGLGLDAYSKIGG